MTQWEESVKPCPVASAVENGVIYVVMARTAAGSKPRVTSLEVTRMSTGEVLYRRELRSVYLALRGGLLWEHAGRRLLEEYMATIRRQLRPEQVSAYDRLYEEGGDPVEQ